MGEEFDQLSQEEIHELKHIINEIMANNRESLLPNLPILEDQVMKSLELEFVKSKLIVDKIATIAISILEDASRVIDHNFNLRERSQELLEAFQTVELDNYEFREENEKLRDMLSQCSQANDQLLQERDSAIHKNKQAMQQFLQINQNLEQEITALRKELLLAEHQPKTNNFSAHESNTIKDSFVKEEINLLMCEISKLKADNFYKEKELFQVNHKLDSADTMIKELERSREILAKQKYFQTPIFSKQNSMIEIEDDFIIPCSSLKVELESIPNFYLSEEKTGLHKKSIISIGEQDESEITSENKENSIQKIDQHEVSETQKITEVHLQHQELTGSREDLGSQPNEGPFQKQQKELEASEKKSEAEGEGEGEVEKEGQKEGEKEKEEQGFREGQREGENPEKGILMEEVYNFPVEISGQESQEKSLSIKHSLLKKFQIPTQTRNFRLDRMKSLSNALGSTGETAHQAKLYKKYRGQLISKYPQLEKFTNKVLEKKAEIIADCLTLSRCSSNQTFFKKEGS